VLLHGCLHDECAYYVHVVSSAAAVYVTYPCPNYCICALPRILAQRQRTTTHRSINSECRHPFFSACYLILAIYLFIRYLIYTLLIMNLVLLRTPCSHGSALMRDALNATGRPIYFALCGWSSWYAPVGATLGNSWRYGYDVNDWNSAYSNSIAASSALAADAGVGAWNDPDALIGTSSNTAVHMTQKQSRTQMTLWAMMAAPLEIGSNILNMNKYDLETYMNSEVIAVDQDKLGQQGSVFSQSAKCNMHPVAAVDAWTGRTSRYRRKVQQQNIGKFRTRGTCTALPDCQQIWTRNLSNGDLALAFVNYTQVLLPPPVVAQQQQPRSGGGHVTLAACAAGNKEQLWQVASGGMTTVKSMGASKSCWEVRCEASAPFSAHQLRFQRM
jgi:hypothetical protein